MAILLYGLHACPLKKKNDLNFVALCRTQVLCEVVTDKKCQYCRAGRQF